MKTFTYLIGLMFLSVQLCATVPVVNNVTVNGTNHVGATLTGTYIFFDSDGDSELGSLYQWFRADDNSGANRIAIAGATAITYNVTGSDEGKYIMFEAMPIDNNSEVGLTVGSSYTNVIYNHADITYSKSGIHNVSGREDYGNFTANKNITINVGAGDSLIIWVDFTVKNNTIINVDVDGFFEIKSFLTAQNSPIVTVNGDLLVSGDVDVKNNATFNVSPDGMIDISGSLISGNNATINVEGAMYIGRNLEVGNNATLNIDMDNDGTGFLQIGGDFIAAPNAIVEGYGAVTVGGTVSHNVNDTFGNQVNSTLPIELVYFKVELNEDVVELKWQTAVEINNDYFTVERSEDGIEFYSIETIKGEGFSDYDVTYLTTDYIPLEGISYYRLKQTDFDGKYSYSELQMIQNSYGTSLDISSILIYPNPVNKTDGFFNIKVMGDLGYSTIKVQIMDYGGQEIYTTNIELSGGFSNNKVNINGIRGGNYIVVVSTETQTFIDKIVIL